MARLSHLEFIEAAYERMCKEDPANGITKAKFKQAVNKTLEELKDRVADQDIVNLHGFGIFSAKEREATNPSAYATGEGPHRINTAVVKFKASVAFKDAVKKAFGVA